MSFKSHGTIHLKVLNIFFFLFFVVSCHIQYMAAYTIENIKTSPKEVISTRVIS